MFRDMKTIKFISMLAFIAILFAAIALLIARISSGTENNLFIQVAGILKQISYAFAFIVSGIYAYGYIRSKNIVWLIIYIIACIAVAILLILPMFKI